MKINTFLVLLGLNILSFFKSNAQCSSTNFGDAAEYSVFTFSDFTSTVGDQIWGRAAIGGNFTVSNYGIGANGCLSDNASRVDLVVGGNLNFNGGQVSNGSVKYGGSLINSPSLAVGGATVSSGSLGVNFASTETLLKSNSTYWSTLSTTGTINNSGFGTITLTGASNTLNVFNLTAAAVQQYGYLNLEINVPTTSTVLINVSGSLTNMPQTTVTYNGSQINTSTATNLGYQTCPQSKIIWNIGQSTTAFNMTYVGFQGTILAPWADVTATSGEMNGQLIVNSISQSSPFASVIQVHCTRFQGCLSMTACNNATSGGTIGFDETLCGSIVDPTLIQNLTLPSGGSGTLEYIWLVSTDAGSTFSVIAGSNSSTYDPGNISVSTWFRRCARRSGCPSYDVESNWVEKQVCSYPVANAGTDKNLNCTTTSSAIGTASVVGNTYSWSPSTGLNNVSIAQPTANPSLNTSYTITVTNSCGCSSTDAVNVYVNNSSPTADAGSTLNLNCTTTSGIIGTSAIGGNSYAWLPATGLSSTSIAQPTASPSSTTTYTVTVTGSNGCTSTSSVTVNYSGNPPTADAGSTLNINCTTTNGIIGTTSIVGNTYSWSPSTGLSATNIAQPTASPSTTTIYTVTVTGSNGCTATSNVTINVNTIAPTADAGSTLNLNCTTTSGTIGTTSVVGNTYGWSPSTGLSATNIAQPTASPTATTIYTVTVTGSNGCTTTSSVTVNVNTTSNKPSIISYPNNQYCFGDNIVLKAIGEPGAIFTWNTPVAAVITSIDNSVSGESSLMMSGISAFNNGYYSVSQNQIGCASSALDTVLINGALKPSINFITTSCVSNNGEITVNANGSNLEYAVNGGAFQSSNILTTSAGSTFIVSIKEAGSSCINYYEGQCVSCMAPGACATPPQDSIVADSKTCVNTPISITGYFSNASNATWTTSGTGTFSTNTCNASPCTVTYTPSATDIANSHVVITLSTDDPDGAGPCAAAVCSKNIELYNGTVAPTISNNGPVCENTTLSLTATGSDGSITWIGPSGYSGNGDSIAITNAPVSMSGLYTATSNISGCTSSSASQNAVVVAIPTLTVSAIGHPELCAGGGNGSITVSVSGGSGVYDICYTGNLGNCVTGTSANFPWIAPGSYNVTVVDQICPNNVFTYPVTVAPGTPVPVPTISSNYSTCGGESLTLSGTVTAPAVNILWVHGPTFLNAVGNPLVIQNATMSMSGNYYAKAIDINGCASPQVATVVTISEKPVITHVQVNCFGSTATVTISATSATGTLSYSLDGTNYQASNEFTTVGQGNYTVHVKNGSSNCEATLPIYILNCACPNAPVVTMTAPSVSCGTTAIPVSASFTNVGNATWSTTGTGTFSTTSGASPLASVYTPSATDIATGHVNLVVTTDDPDGAGPCSPTSETVSILLKDTLLQPSIITNQASYCQDDTLMLTSNTTNPIVWTGVGGFYADSSVGVVTGLTPFLSGYYKVSSTGNGCATKSDSVFITVAPAPVITVTKSVVDENCEGHANGEVTITATGGSGSYTICNSLFLNCAATSSSNTFKWLAPSTYTFYVADASCKSHQTSITATVGSGLHVDPPTGASYNSPVCVGEGLILTATGTLGSTYLWTDMTNNYTATGEVVTRTDAQTGMSGNYKVQRLESGCASIDILLPVHIYDNPIITSADTMCMGSIDSGRITINANIAIGDAIEYALNDGAYQSSNVFDNLTNGLFQLKARAVGSDCETTMNGLELYCACYCGKDAQVNVFPNPNDGTFNLNVNLVPKDASLVVTVFDMSGRTVYEQALEESNGQVTTSIDIKAYASGPYMVRVLVDGERFLVPIMVSSK